MYFSKVIYLTANNVAFLLHSGGRKVEAKQQSIGSFEKYMKSNQFGDE